MMVAGCQVKGLYKNEKNDTFFVKKVGENEYFNLKNEEKKRRKFYDKGDLKIYFSIKTEINTGHRLKISVFSKVTKKGKKEKTF